MGIKRRSLHALKQTCKLKATLVDSSSSKLALFGSVNSWGRKFILALILIPQMGILSGAKALAEPRQYKIIFSLSGLFEKWRIQVHRRGLKGI
jgi:hypothetical protein